MKTPVRILQLCKKFPYPVRDGEALAISHLSRALVSLGCEVSLLSMNTSKHHFDFEDHKEDFRHYKNIHTVGIDNEIKVVDAFKNLFSKESYHISRFIDQQYADKLEEILREEEFDIVQLETLYLAPYIDTIKANSDAIISMRAHNVEHEIWDRIAKNTKFLPKKLYLKYLSSKLKNFELANLNKYDYLITVSDRDLANFKNLGYKNGAMSLPIGIDSNSYINISPQNDKDLNKICFIGSMDWMPNLEGLDWFLKKVWPTISEKYPEMEFHIAGRNSPKSLRHSKWKNVFLHGEVEDARKFIDQHGLMVVPLFSGSGLRVKILEGMAMTKCIIATELAAEGIAYDNGKHILIANEPESFISKIEYCIENPDKVTEISDNAKSFVKENFDYIEIGKQILETYIEKLKT